MNITKPKIRQLHEEYWKKYQKQNGKPKLPPQNKFTAADIYDIASTAFAIWETYIKCLL